LHPTWKSTPKRKAHMFMDCTVYTDKIKHMPIWSYENKVRERKTEKKL
jgi:hypothetical protein